MRWHSTTDERIATWMRALTPRWPLPSTPNKILVTFGPVTPEFCLGAFVPGGLHAGLCHTFLVKRRGQTDLSVGTWMPSEPKWMNFLNTCKIGDNIGDKQTVQLLKASPLTLTRCIVHRPRWELSLQTPRPPPLFIRKPSLEVAPTTLPT